MTVLIHQVSCTMTSGPRDTQHFEQVRAEAARIEQYARRLGWEVLYENVEEGEA